MIQKSSLHTFFVCIKCMITVVFHGVDSDVAGAAQRAVVAVAARQPLQ